MIWLAAAAVIVLVLAVVLGVCAFACTVLTEEWEPKL